MSRMTKPKHAHRSTQRVERTHPRYLRYQVTFRRGALIECRTKAEIRAMARTHLARAHKYRVADGVVSVCIRKTYAGKTKTYKVRRPADQGGS